MNRLSSIIFILLIGSLSLSAQCSTNPRLQLKAINVFIDPNKNEGMVFGSNYCESSYYNQKLVPLLDSLGVLPINKIIEILGKRKDSLNVNGLTFRLRKRPFKSVWEFKTDVQFERGGRGPGNVTYKYKIITINANNGKILRVKKHKYRTMVHWPY